jgi:hypothetical protein
MSAQAEAIWAAILAGEDASALARLIAAATDADLVELGRIVRETLALALKERLS